MDYAGGLGQAARARCGRFEPVLRGAGAGRTWSFAAAQPGLEDYAAFRAAGETFRAPWRQWPDVARAGRLSPSDAPEAARNYHRYVQYVAEAQLTAARGSGAAGLLLDLPLGRPTPPGTTSGVSGAHSCPGAPPGRRPTR